MNIPADTLRLACMALQSAVPSITPACLQSMLEKEFDKPEQRQLDLISVKEAAQVLGVHDMTVYRMVARGELKRYPVGTGRAYRLNRYELL
ncbi:hypothetical protein BVY04_04450 [bacterium M21]|nr:hypothetical protein BVY04_04450 [bacterium M21]